MVSLDGTACVPFVYPHFISPRTTDKEDQADPTMNDCCRSVRMEIILMDLSDTPYEPDGPSADTTGLKDGIHPTYILTVDTS